jgi:hypothetical protein
MNDFLRTRDAGTRPVTQEQVNALMKDEKERSPYGGAGSFAAHLKRASKQYKPTDARGRLSAAERKQFAAENAEVIYTSPEDRVRIDAAVAENLKLYDFQQYFANAVRNRVALDEAWTTAGYKGVCPFFNGIERDGDPAGAPEKQRIAALRAFANSPVFAAYRSEDRTSERFKVQSQIVALLCEFLTDNLVNMTLPSSYAACFGLLERIGLIPAPVKSDAELRAAAEAAERNAPADDGNPVALIDGKPVTYKFKDGRVVKYSQSMLDSLNSASYAKVVGLERTNPQLPLPVEITKTNDADQPMSPDDYRNRAVGNTGMTQAQLDQLPSEEYRRVMRLSRNPRAMKPFERVY